MTKRAARHGSVREVFSDCEGKEDVPGNAATRGCRFSDFVEGMTVVRRWISTGLAFVWMVILAAQLGREVWMQEQVRVETMEAELAKAKWDVKWREDVSTRVAEAFTDGYESAYEEIRPVPESWDMCEPGTFEQVVLPVGMAEKAKIKKQWPEELGVPDYVEILRPGSCCCAEGKDAKLPRSNEYSGPVLEVDGVRVKRLPPYVDLQWNSEEERFTVDGVDGVEDLGLGIGCPPPEVVVKWKTRRDPCRTGRLTWRDFTLEMAGVRRSASECATDLVTARECVGGSFDDDAPAARRGKMGLEDVDAGLAGMPADEPGRVAGGGLRRVAVEVVEGDADLGGAYRAVRVQHA